MIFYLYAKPKRKDSVPNTNTLTEHSPIDIAQLAQFQLKYYGSTRADERGKREI